MSLWIVRSMPEAVWRAVYLFHKSPSTELPDAAVEDAEVYSPQPAGCHMPSLRHLPWLQAIAVVVHNHDVLPHLSFFVVVLYPTLRNTPLVSNLNRLHMLPYFLLYTPLYQNNRLFLAVVTI